MKKLQQEIKDKIFHSVYLLTGEEGYLRSQYCKNLKNAICGDNTMNLNVFKGKDPDINKVLDLCDTVPFFSDKRVVSVENSGIFGTGGLKDGDKDRLLSLKKNLPDTTVLIFSEESVDKRGSVYKAIKKQGSVTEFPVQEEETLVKWIMKLAKDEGKSINPKDASYLIGMVGKDMTNLYSEWEKLISFSLYEGDITKSHIDAICTRTVEDRVFQMIDSMSSGDRSIAFSLYEDLLALGTKPPRILYLLVRHFRILNNAYDYMSQGLSKSELASKLGVRPFFVGKYIDQAKKYGKDRLHKALEDCADTDMNFKTGKMSDRIGVELLITEYSMF